MPERPLPDERFTVDAVCNAAREAAGLEDFGPEAFVEPLTALLESLTRDAGLNAHGRQGQFTRIVDLLVNRLRVEHWISRHPDILDEALEPPVVIAGLMRTGTTLLQRLLACNPAFQAPLWYEVRFPAPMPEHDFAGHDARIPIAEREVAGMLAASPGLEAIHPLDATAPDEEILLLEQAFYSTVPASFAYLPGYMDWLDGHDNTPGYRYLHKLLRFLQWQRRQRGEPPRPWLLKSPHHLMHMDTLRSVFPGARVIQTHRDPLQTIPSACSMNCALAAGASDTLDVHAFATRWKDLFAGGLERTLDIRATAPDDFIDVDYRETATEPMALMRRLHAQLGLPLDQRVEARMEQWLAANRREDRAAHHYTLAQFGFTAEGLAQDFARYRETHIIDTGKAG